MNTHTIELDDGKGGKFTDKRVSENRAYVACVVATVTDNTVKIARENFNIEVARYKAALAKAKAELVAAGVTFEAAKARIDAQRAKCDTKEVRERQSAIRREVYDSTNWSPNSANLVREREAAEGILDAHYDPLFNAVCTVERDATHTEPTFEAPLIGRQHVITWCGRLDLASKALKGKDVSHFLKRGFFCEVRTDIKAASREVTKRAPSSKPRWRANGNRAAALVINGKDVLYVNEQWHGSGKASTWVVRRPTEQTFLKAGEWDALVIAETNDRDAAKAFALWLVS